MSEENKIADSQREIESLHSMAQTELNAKVRPAYEVEFSSPETVQRVQQLEGSSNTAPTVDAKVMVREGEGRFASGALIARFGGQED